MDRLSILILSDGRPGHYHLAEGIAAAAARLRPVDLARIELSRRCPGRIAAALVNAPLPPRWVLRTVYGGGQGALPEADLIISAGAETLAANISLARLRGVPNIFYGSLRQYRPTDFSLVLTSYAGSVTSPRQVMALKPSPIDADTLPNRHALTPLGPGHPPRTASLLIGGNSGTFSYGADDWAQLLALVEATYREHRTRWIISNSRRTDPAISDQIAARASDPTNAIDRFIDVRTARSGGLQEVFSLAEAIVCTDDSSTMVSEAISACLPVIGVTPQRYSFTEDEQGYRSYLLQNGWYRSVPLSGLTADRLLEELGQVRPLTENPHARLAALLRERIPALFPAGGKKDPQIST